MVLGCRGPRCPAFCGGWLRRWQVYLHLYLLLGALLLPPSPCPARGGEGAGEDQGEGGLKCEDGGRALRGCGSRGRVARKLLSTHPLCSVKTVTQRPTIWCWVAETKVPPNGKESTHTHGGITSPCRRQVGASLRRSQRSQEVHASFRLREIRSLPSATRSREPEARESRRVWPCASERGRVCVPTWLGQPQTGLGEELLLIIRLASAIVVEL